MLATTTPMLATNNYYQARPDRVEAKKNRPRTPKRPRPDTARRPQGLQEIRKEQRRESADFDQNQKTIKFKIGHKIPQGLIKSRRWSTAGDISRNCAAPATCWLDPEHAPPNAEPVFPEQQVRKAISRKRKDHRILQYRKEKGALSPPRPTYASTDRAARAAISKSTLSSVPSLATSLARATSLSRRAAQSFTIASVAGFSRRSNSFAMAPAAL